MINRAAGRSSIASGRVVLNCVNAQERGLAAAMPMEFASRVDCEVAVPLAAVRWLISAALAWFVVVDPLRLGATATSTKPENFLSCAFRSLIGRGRPAVRVHGPIVSHT
jgi:hypothetical protein